MIPSNQPLDKNRAPRKNEQIRVPSVKVIDENGQMLGELSTATALAKAREAGLDLIEINPNERPPVCKIIDYGKYVYSQQKKEKAKRAGSKKTEIKEVRIGFQTGNHDLETSRRKIKTFLSNGNRVKIALKMKGREQAHKALAIEKLGQFVDSIEIAEPEGSAEALGRAFYILVKPRKSVNKPNPTQDT
ncbi:MAG: translation initiation factor IF-3 [Patescibacteria group bacterium]|nr:translation initiation factor IF-3 [Patescibacteria group bacterium]